MGNEGLRSKQVGSQASRWVTRRLAWIQPVCISINVVPALKGLKWFVLPVTGTFCDSSNLDSRFEWGPTNISVDPDLWVPIVWLDHHWCCCTRKMLWSWGVETRLPWKLMTVVTSESKHLSAKPGIKIHSWKSENVCVVRKFTCPMLFLSIESPWCYR